MMSIQTYFGAFLERKILILIIGTATHFELAKIGLYPFVLAGDIETCF